MKVTQASLNGVLIVETAIYADERGCFFESFNARRFAELTGLSPPVMQDNHSWSAHNVLRGLHYQIRQPQGKLVRVIAGEVFDVAVDLRRASPTFGRWEGLVLSAENRRQLWIPEGFAHGFVVTSASAEVLYKTTDYWAAEHERCIRWDDSALAIRWPLDSTPVLSAKDALGMSLADAEVFA
jgi:dTDP-4-dehydrorhamnose 3,5-epimerase